MIPTNRTIRARLRNPIPIPSDPFALAEEYVQLSREFMCSSWTDLARLCLHLFGSIFYTLAQLVMGTWSWMSILSLTNPIQTWIRGWRFLTLQQVVDQWVVAVRSVGGPFISTNDPTYHVYVYADAIQRMKNG
jgi:hypothetical protein